ncbi:MAG: rhodanese-like domain-containing protein [Planctomycetota bacterium]|nr:rhodanese-like domain-containing protein [Planctomycetota bacterium]
MTDNSELPLEVDVQTVATMQQSQDSFVLLDVREQQEFDTARIGGSRLIPMSELSERVQELEDCRDQRIVVHCHHGMRSLHVTQALRQAGFSKTQSMAGGIDQWSIEIDDAVPRY